MISKGVRFSFASRFFPAMIAMSDESTIQMIVESGANINSLFFSTVHPVDYYSRPIVNHYAIYTSSTVNATLLMVACASG